MGDFRVVLEASGGHGCDRKAKEGDDLRGCGQETCPDCITARFVSAMQRAGMRPNVATFTHWPASMRAHIYLEDKPEKCHRCGVQAGDPMPCRNYDIDHEVVDDYSERDVKYPTGAFIRASGKRVHGSF
jgi:hypothetical protein